MTDTPLITRHRQGFGPGVTEITREDGAAVDFAIHKLRAGERHSEHSKKETAWVLLQGSAVLDCDGKRHAVQRSSLFDESPSVLHVATGTEVVIEATSDCELAVARVSSTTSFASRLFTDCAREARGKGLVQEAALREVRTVFDLENRPEAGLVVGEVVSYPGKWSSYPPHHHAQPELYHYRFSLPQGYGHAELGEAVYKVRHGDTLLIPGGLDHPQVAAPGYAMYYLWVVRHLQGSPYRGFEFTPEHAWVLDPKQQGWRPQ